MLTILIQPFLKPDSIGVEIGFSDPIFRGAKLYLVFLLGCLLIH